jgi:hypothetical protein
LCSARFSGRLRSIAAGVFPHSIGASVRDVEFEWFQMRIDGALSQKRGAAFQDFFAEIMEAAYPGDFERVRAYGNRGDLKCDGLLRSSGTVFQVYAPRYQKVALLLRKIGQDFAGAKEHWANTMRAWTFVHNDPEGLPADVVRAVVALEQENPGIAIETWACDRLKSVCVALPRLKLVGLFGRPPSRQDFERLTFEPIAKVLVAIHGQPPQALDSIQPVSPEKLEANSLNANVADYLRLGRQREHLVQQYFEKHPNPTFGDEVAAAFRGEYLRLKADGLAPDDVFASLQDFAGGTTRGGVEHEAAVLAVLSYLFERCDIFEPPQGVAES